jgi:hypothetical protein
MRAWHTVLPGSVTQARQNWGPGASDARVLRRESGVIQGPSGLATRQYNKPCGDIARCPAVFSCADTTPQLSNALGKQGSGAIDGSVLGREHGINQSPTDYVGRLDNKPSVNIERCTAISAQQVHQARDTHAA